MANLRDFEKVMKALANRRRLAILKYLKVGGRATVGDIAGEIKLSFKSTSKHLQLLAAAGIIEREQISLQMWYQIVEKLPDGVKPVLSIL